jgi:hypothetical protein
MKNLIFTLLVLTSITSCSSIHSNLFVKPNDSFVLGKNIHGKFKVRLKNISTEPVEVYQISLNGSKQASKLVAPNELVKVIVAQNTALFIQNSSRETASLMIKVTGDTGLSMSYQK